MRGKPQTTAGLFAAKEAVAKALGTGFSGFWPNEIEIIHDKTGKPYVLLHKKAAFLAESIGAASIIISITHHKTSAAAVAVLEK